MALQDFIKLIRQVGNQYKISDKDKAIMELAQMASGGSFAKDIKSVYMNGVKQTIGEVNFDGRDYKGFELNVYNINEYTTIQCYEQENPTGEDLPIINCVYDLYTIRTNITNVKKTTTEGSYIALNYNTMFFVLHVHNTKI